MKFIHYYKIDIQRFGEIVRHIGLTLRRLAVGDFALCSGGCGI